MNHLSFALNPCRARVSTTAALTFLLGLLAPVHAQTLPDAGALLRESERGLQAPHTSERKLPAQALPTAAASATASRVMVRSFALEGVTLIPAQALQKLLAHHIGQPLTVVELEHVAQRIAEYYRQSGWYARVFLPQQDVTQGVIRLQVLEGRYSGSTLQAPEGLRADAPSVHQTITQRLQAGAPLPAADLERGLLLANDLPGVHAQGLLLAGHRQGETQLSVTVQDTAYVTGDVGVNNYGVQSTGVAQVVGGVALNNLNGSGDQLALRMLAASDIASAWLRYSMPLGHDGMRLAFHGSTLDYRLNGRYQSLEAKGKAHTAGVALSYPLVRQAQRNVQLSAGYEHRRYNDNMLQDAVRRHRVNAFSFGAHADLNDHWGGGGISWGRVQLTRGHLGIKDIGSDLAQDAAGPRSKGISTKLALEIARLQQVGDGWQLQGSVSGQLSSGNLGSSERFTLGGPQQVRAYPVNEASGDQGVLVKLELQRALGQGWQAVAFYDAGRIQQHRHVWAGWQGGRAQSNYYSLAGAGLGVNWRRDGWLLNASIAAPMGGHAGADAQGRNNDGSSTQHARGWVQLTRTF